MVPIISVVGPSKADRTLLVEKLVAELTARGYKVATAKRDAHCYDLDTPGKASWRHSQAGAQTVVVSSSKKVTVFKQVKEERTLDELARDFFSDSDIVIADGYTTEKKSKIKVLLSKAEEDNQIPKNELFSVVTDAGEQNQINGIPRFSSEEIAGLADLIETKFLNKSSGRI